MSVHLSLSHPPHSSSDAIIPAHFTFAAATQGMLRVYDLTTRVTHSVSLLPESTAAHVAAVMARARANSHAAAAAAAAAASASQQASQQQPPHGGMDLSLYAVVTALVPGSREADASSSHAPPLVARRLRPDARPLSVSAFLRQALGEEPRFLTANAGEDEAKFVRAGIRLDVSESPFFGLVESMGRDDWCGYVDTKEGSEPYRRWWWVLHGERLWHAASHLDSLVGLVPLASARVVSLPPPPPNIVYDPATTFELHTPLSSFRLRCATPDAAAKWMSVLKQRIVVVTESEFFTMAELLTRDHERVAARRDDAAMERACVSLERLLETRAGVELFARYARPRRAEPLVLFVADAMAALKSSSASTEQTTAHMRALLKRFEGLMAPSSSSVFFPEGDDAGHQLAAALERVKRELENTVYAELVADADAHDRLLSDLPLWLETM